MSSDFSDAIAKLEQSRFHAKKLRERIDAYLSTEFYSLVFDEHAKALILKSLHQPDKQINTAFGDAVGNLRSVLDYIINAALEPITGKFDATFPFADQISDWEGKVRSLCSHDAAQPVKDLLTEKVEGYKGGKGEVLWQLNKLRNIDKHRLLLVTTSIAGVRMWGTVNHSMRMNGGIMGGSAGNDQYLISGINHLALTRDPEPVFKVNIRELDIVGGVNVLEYMEKADKEVERILSEFQRL